MCEASLTVAHGRRRKRKVQATQQKDTERLWIELRWSADWACQQCQTSSRLSWKISKAFLRSQMGEYRLSVLKTSSTCCVASCCHRSLVLSWIDIFWLPKLLPGTWRCPNTPPTSEGLLGGRFGSWGRQSVQLAQWADLRTRSGDGRLPMTLAKLRCPSSLCPNSVCACGTLQHAGTCFHNLGINTQQWEFGPRRCAVGRKGESCVRVANQWERTHPTHERCG